MGLVSMLQAGAGHALAQAAVFEEIFFQTADLLVNQVIGLMDLKGHMGRIGLILGASYCNTAHGQPKIG